MSYVITGGLGFIGSNVVRTLNARGNSDIVIVDQYSQVKRNNLLDVSIKNFIDKSEFRPDIHVQHGDIVIHLGAKSSTVLDDFEAIHRDNIQSSARLFEFQRHSSQHVRLIYASSASVYGPGHNFCENAAKSTKSLYAWSKATSENAACGNSLGLRFFNVYGPHESHKGGQSSCVYQFWQCLQREESIKVFRPCDSIARDFIHVVDVADVCLYFASAGSTHTGIINVGSGHATTFLKMAELTSSAHAALHNTQNLIKIVETDANITLSPHYQTYTCADLTKLRRLGYDGTFRTVEQGVHEYCEWLATQ